MKSSYLLLLLLIAGCKTMGYSRGCQPGVCTTACKPNPFSHPCNEPMYCRGLNEWHTRVLARIYAKKSLIGCKGATSDYRHGYEQAFVDISMGASGEVPALAPINYWHDHNRSACGHAQAQDWFAGYAAGASQALACRGPFNVVASSTDSGYHNEYAHSLAPDCRQGSGP